MDVFRRNLLKAGAAGSVIATALAAGLLRPARVLAAPPARAAFEAKDLAGALKGIGAEGAADHDALRIKAPDIAENGAVVPVDIQCSLPGVTTIAVLVDKNPLPLSALFEFAQGALPEVALRLKMGETSRVEAIARTADGKTWRARKEVKVTIGGCGG